MSFRSFFKQRSFLLFLVVPLALLFQNCGKGFELQQSTPLASSTVLAAPSLLLSANTEASSPDVIPVGSQLQIQVDGGTAPFSYQVISGTGSVTEEGFFSAPLQSETDVIEVIDAKGLKGSLSLFVQEKVAGISSPLEVATSNAILTPGQRAQIQVTGGLPPYSYQLLHGAGSVDAQGLFVAPAAGFEFDVIEVTDANQASTHIVILINRGVSQPNAYMNAALPSFGQIAVLPNSTSSILDPTEKISIQVKEGQAPYRWRLLTGTGAISPNGNFTAPAQMNEFDMIEVVDANGLKGYLILTITK